jgi:septum formation protein
VTYARSLVLASGSPRRRELLGLFGYPFTVRAADINEDHRAGESPALYVERLAIEKATAVARPGELVLAADTTVAFQGRVLGKPTDPGDAIDTLRQLAGHAHHVYTGMALVDGQSGALLHSHVDTATVHMRTYDTDLINWYVGTGEPLDKAGSYAVQGAGSTLVTRIDGHVQTVIGLTMTVLYDWLHPWASQLTQPQQAR